MDQRIVIRGHLEDIAKIKLCAMNQGMDMSGFIRQLLIKEKIIDVTWTDAQAIQTSEAISKEEEGLWTGLP